MKWKGWKSRRIEETTRQLKVVSVVTGELITFLNGNPAFRRLINNEELCLLSVQFCNGTYYGFNGSRITFNPDDVWPVVPNATMDSYENGSDIWNLAQDVNQEYSEVLRGLELTFNSDSSALHSVIVNGMFNLETAILNLMQHPIPPITNANVGPNAAPTYTYIPSTP